MQMAREATLDQFKVRLTTQKEWHILILVAFFLGGVGGGLFLVSSFFGFTFGLFLAWLIVVIGKGSTHLVYLGRPLRFWKIFTSWSAFKTSWITRGMWGMVVFIIFGALYIAPQLEWFTWLPWTSGSIAGRVILGLAAVGAAWVMMYTGFVMAQSPAIAFWNTPILPALFVLYGLVGGIDLAFISVAVLGNTSAIDIKILEAVQIFLFILIIIFVLAYLALMSSSRIGAQEAVRMITKGELSFVFWGVVIVVGIVIPLAEVSYAYFVGGVPMAVTGAVGLLALVGCLYFRHVVMRAGVYGQLI